MPREKKTKNILAVSKNTPADSKSYSQVFELLKSDIRQSQLKASLSITRELTLLYWRTGKILAEKINKEGWGAKTLERLAFDIKKEFPDLSGFSLRNLKYMRQFAECFHDDIWAAAAAQIPWGHNIFILDKIEKQEPRLWHIQQTIENGWSRSMLESWIKSDLYKRQGKAITNFKETLPPSQSDLAEQTLKDPYNFSFLALDKKYREQELGQGFAFVGKQYLLKHEDDQPSIGIILCKTKDNVFVKYVLRNFNRPIGVAEFEVKLTENLPKELKSSLPTVEEIEAELEQDIQNIESPDTKKKGRKKNEEK